MRDDPTVGEVLRKARRNGSTVQIDLERAALQVVSRLRRSLRMQEADCEDLAHEVWLLAVLDDFHALRRADPDAPLAAWMTTTAKNLRRRQLDPERAIPVGPGDPDAFAPPEREDEDDEQPAADSEPTATDRVASLLDALPPEQRRVEQALLDGGTERAAAKRLGVRRDHVHDVNRRAKHRLVARLGPWHPDTDRSWALAVAERMAALGQAENARLLRMYADGRARGEIAIALVISEAAVRDRIHRARLWL